METPFDDIKASKRLKNYLDINPEIEPHKYRIYHELSKHGQCIIEDVRSKNWWKEVSKKIGIEIKKINNKTTYVYPPISNRKHNFAVIPVHKKTKIFEKELRNNVKRFIFKHL